MSGSEVHELAVKIDPEGIEETTQGLEDMDRQFEESADSIEDTSGEMERFSRKWKGAMTVVAAGFAAATGTLLSRMPIIDEVSSGLFSVLDTLGIKLSQELRPKLGKVSEDLFELSESIAEASSAAGAMGITVAGIITAFDDVLAGLTVRDTVDFLFEVGTVTIDEAGLKQKLRKNVEDAISEPFSFGQETFELIPFSEVVGSVTSTARDLGIAFAAEFTNESEKELRENTPSFQKSIDGVVDSLDKGLKVVLGVEPDLPSDTTLQERVDNSLGGIVLELTSDINFPSSKDVLDTANDLLGRVPTPDFNLDFGFPSESDIFSTANSLLDGVKMPKIDTDFNIPSAEDLFNETKNRADLVSIDPPNVDLDFQTPGPDQLFQQTQSVASRVADRLDPIKFQMVVEPPSDPGGREGECPPGMVRNPATGECIPEQTRDPGGDPPDRSCPPGEVRNPNTGNCVPLQEGTAGTGGTMSTRSKPRGSPGRNSTTRDGGFHAFLDATRPIETVVNLGQKEIARAVGEVQDQGVSKRGR